MKLSDYDLKQMDDAWVEGTSLYTTLERPHFT